MGERVIADRQPGDLTRIERVWILGDAGRIGILPRIWSLFSRLVSGVGALNLGDVLLAGVLQLAHLLRLDEAVDQVERRTLKCDGFQKLLLDLGQGCVVGRVPRWREELLVVEQRLRRGEVARNR